MVMTERGHITKGMICNPRVDKGNAFISIVSVTIFTHKFTHKYENEYAYLYASNSTLAGYLQQSKKSNSNVILSGCQGKASFPGGPVFELYKFEHGHLP